MASYHIETYGCTSNVGESRQIERALRDGGHHPVGSPAAADVAILNTCTVIETTADKMLRRAATLAEQTSDLIITGCMALTEGERFAAAGIDAQVLHWDEVPTAVRNGECPTTTPDTEPIIDGVIGILPIARGCMSNCSYCITKFATGRIDSPPVSENVERARALVEAGARELRITGQDTGVYGWDRGRRRLPELLERICTEVDGDYRVRVGMANPGGVHGIADELAAVFAAQPKLYNFLHIPVQSGSDAVLEAMRRQHRVAQFREIVDIFDAQLPTWTLSTDFIVGFPTETDADHAASMRLLADVAPTKTNVTRFSKRPGTAAAELKGLGGQTKKDRSRALSARVRALTADRYEAMVGTEREVLVVEPGTGRSVKCRDDAYRQLIIQDAADAGVDVGDRLTVEVTAPGPVYAFCEPA